MGKLHNMMEIEKSELKDFKREYIRFSIFHARQLRNYGSCKNIVCGRIANFYKLRRL